MSIRTIVILSFIAICNSAVIANTTSGDKEKQVLDLIQETGSPNDDWMTAIKLAMKGDEKRKFKVESSMTFEFDDMDEDSSGPSTTVTMVEDMLPIAEIPGAGVSSRNFMSRVLPGPNPVNAFSQAPKMMKQDKMVIGDVGICRTLYQVETVTTAKLLHNTNKKVTLAHPIEMMVGKCRDIYPTVSVGIKNGGCVLAAQTHKVYVIAPMQDQKNYRECVNIPGITTFKKCAAWIVVGGRCVFEHKTLIN